MISIISFSNSQQHPNLCNSRPNRGFQKHTKLAILTSEAFLRETKNSVTHKNYSSSMLTACLQTFCVSVATEKISSVGHQMSLPVVPGLMSGEGGA